MLSSEDKFVGQMRFDVTLNSQKQIVEITAKTQTTILNTGESEQLNFQDFSAKYFLLSMILGDNDINHCPHF